MTSINPGVKALSKHIDNIDKLIVKREAKSGGRKYAIGHKISEAFKTILNILKTGIVDKNLRKRSLVIKELKKLDKAFASLGKEEKYGPSKETIAKIKNSDELIGALKSDRDIRLNLKKAMEDLDAPLKEMMITKADLSDESKKLYTELFQHVSDTNWAMFDEDMKILGEVERDKKLFKKNEELLTGLEVMVEKLESSVKENNIAPSQDNVEALLRFERMNKKKKSELSESQFKRLAKLDKRYKAADEKRELLIDKRESKKAAKVKTRAEKRKKEKEADKPEIKETPYGYVAVPKEALKKAKKAEAEAKVVKAKPKQEIEITKEMLDKLQSEE